MINGSSDPVLILEHFLDKLVEKEGSDLFVKSSAVVTARIEGDLTPLTTETLSAFAVESIARHILGAQYETFEQQFEYDTMYVLNAESRFRVNLFWHLDGIAMVFRLVPLEIKTIEALNLPDQLHRLTKLQRGLVLVTGTTGSGKSTTLASLIEEINRERRKHVITIEDPVEFVHIDKKCVIEQRNVGLHTKGFNQALRAAMRENPDIIMVGEMRDLETAENVLQAVNTGHLVFSTLHTLDAKETIDRLIAIFPPFEQERVRLNLASNLEAVVSQRLIHDKNGALVPACEMLFRSPMVEHLIRTKRDFEINDIMANEHSHFGSTTFNQALFELCLKDVISEEVAYSQSGSPTDLQLMFAQSSEYQKKIGNTLENIKDEVGLKQPPPLVEPE
ncbi:PilT/PilU family type 4a pilus ATPase [Sulfurimonas sp. HSL-3221]|uniref:type IV pilus twitching motility protein PilT n=1 Tax=Sulfurimonadaceae TaxID=2771471 RepID=UPI001E545D96|nr:PilT/PilU family type 4a pilus ATPase [Sulfurimonas sp. HSL-3221]UFS62666.1 PilT/PilU family type 4a pilus ATPase [Sulfurimonas sp. HSL-3221]